MKNHYTNTKAYFAAHKGMAAAVLIVLVGIGYYGYQKASAKTVSTKYVLGTVEKGTLITAITGTGQVAADDQVDIKPSVSGTVTAVDVAEGDQVKEGQTIAQLQAIDANQAVRDAEVNLQVSQLALQKLQNPTGTNLLQAQDSVTSAQNSLATAYDDGLGDIGTAVQDLSSISNDLNDILYDSAHSPYMADNLVRIYASDSGLQEKMSAGVKYDTAKKDFDALEADYRTVNRNSDKQTIENLIDQAHTATQDMADAVKAVKTAIDLFQTDQTGGIPKEMTADEATLASDVSKVNGDVSNLGGVQNTITSSKQTINEKQSSLGDITSPDQSTLASAQLDVESKRVALEDAEEKLAEYTIKAPFDGVVATLDVKKGDSVSSTAVATLITKQQIATVSLNEVDVAKVKVGEKATLTFDAITDLTITGQVDSIDTIGTVTQGVVSYNVKIGFDTQDDRVKPGMSATANIITDSKTDALLVPTSAIKTVGGQSIVQELPGVDATGAALTTGVASPTAPKNVTVVTGDTNGTQTEITSGVNEGDVIVTRTVAAAATASTASTARTGTSLLGGGAGAGARVGAGAAGGFRGN